MTSNAYLLTHERSFAALLAALNHVFDIREEPQREFNRLFLDTVDWRLHRAGLTLERRTQGDEFEWRCYNAGDGSLLAHTRYKGPVRFARDLPGGSLRELLLPLTRARVLVTLVHVRTVSRTIGLLDKTGKLIARLELVTDSIVTESDGVSAEPSFILRLSPVRGYESHAHRIRALIRDELGLVAADPDPLVAPLAAIGRRPGASADEVGVMLVWSDSAATAMRHVFRILLDAMLDNEAGVRDDLDSEFLHDYRIAIRRTRSALGQVKSVFPADIVDRFRAEFAWLGQVTGPTRDLDVYLLQFDNFRTAIPPELRYALDPLHTLLINHQHSEHKALVMALDSPRYAALIRDWANALSPQTPVDERAEYALSPIGIVATRRIRRTVRQTFREARRVDRRSSADQLHELRKSSKKLRYVMELFQSLYPDKLLRQPLAETRRLQDVLGRYQDLQVQRSALAGFAEELATDGAVERATLLAMGALDSHLHQQQLRTREEVVPAIDRFIAPKTQRRFRRLESMSGPALLG